MTKDERFSLSTVLRYRKNVEDEVAREAAQLRKRLEEEELLLLEMEKRKEAAIAGLRKKKEPTVEEINISYRFLSTIEMDINGQKKKVSDMAKEYDRKREELISAAMDKKIMETMRDKEWEEHKRMVWALEQKNLDEIATNGYCRGI